jgi:hypothetical protein
MADHHFISYSSADGADSGLALAHFLAGDLPAAWATVEEAATVPYLRHGPRVAVLRGLIALRQANAATALSAYGEFMCVCRVQFADGSQVFLDRYINILLNEQATADAVKVGIGASIVLISDCQDNQVSLDGEKNGLFTAALLKVWDKGKFSGGLRRFHKEIQLRIDVFQSPNYLTLGAANSTFERQKPFTI